MASAYKPIIWKSGLGAFPPFLLPFLLPLRAFWGCLYSSFSALAWICSSRLVTAIVCQGSEASLTILRTVRVCVCVCVCVGVGVFVGALKLVTLYIEGMHLACGLLN